MLLPFGSGRRFRLSNQVANQFHLVYEVFTTHRNGDRCQRAAGQHKQRHAFAADYVFNQSFIPCQVRTHITVGRGFVPSDGTRPAPVVQEGLILLFGSQQFL